MSRITLSTVKSFIRKNPNLYINNQADFDGMQDCVVYNQDSKFRKTQKPEEGYDHKNKLGIAGAWFVFGSRDYFTEYEDSQLKGYEIYNCCGKFILATKREVAA